MNLHGLKKEKRKFISKRVYLFLAILICTFLFVGCDEDKESNEYKVLVLNNETYYHEV